MCASCVVLLCGVLCCANWPAGLDDGGCTHVTAADADWLVSRIAGISLARGYRDIGLLGKGF